MTYFHLMIMDSTFEEFKSFDALSVQRSIDRVHAEEMQKRRCRLRDIDDIEPETIQQHSIASKADSSMSPKAPCCCVVSGSISLNLYSRSCISSAYA